MTKIIDLPNSTTLDSNSFLPIYQNGRTRKVPATSLGAAGGLPTDFTSLSAVSSVDGTEVIPVNKPLGTVLRTTVQSILNWILARANTWTANQTISANLDFSGTGRRITADFTNATIGNRALVQTNTANSATSYGIIPSGSGNGASVWLHSSSDTTNSSIGILYTNSTEMGIASSRIGTGTFLPLVFYTSGSPTVSIDTSGNNLTLRGGLGYGVGNGASVTQATDKNTSVTINKPSGRITTSSSALTSGGVVAFAVNCSYYSSTDTISLLLVNGAGGANYRIWATAPGGFASGQFAIFIKNETAGTLSDTLVLQYNIHKGSIT